MAHNARCSAFVGMAIVSLKQRMAQYIKIEGRWDMIIAHPPSCKQRADMYE